MRLVFILTCLLWLCSFLASASHLIAVEIRARPVNCETRLYEITLIGYINTGSGVRFGGEDDVLSFGDGTSVLVPEQNFATIDTLLQIGMVQYTVSHSFPSAGRYILSYKEHARNEGIINMDDSGVTAFYTESSILIEEGHCDSSPYMTVPPVDRACKGVAYFHNPGTFDADDDSLSFSFVAPRSELNTVVKGYLNPNDSRYYNAAGILFNQGNETKNGPPTFTIDSGTGTMTWNAPGAVGEYAFAIKVTSWRFNPETNQWYTTGFSIRDMQVYVEECLNKKPELIVPDELCVEAGTLIEFSAPGSDPDGHQVSIEAFSEVFLLENSPATLTPGDGQLQSTAAPNDTASASFRWNTSCLHVKNQPYNIVFKITDSPPAGPALVQFKTVSIRIIAPPPTINNVDVNPVNKKVTITWDSYGCENATVVQVWRRLAEVAYNEQECDTGIPGFLRYTLIATLPGASTSYVDEDIASGAQYCYRLIALIGDNKVESRVSVDTCLSPITVQAPVITNVSVTETDNINGSVLIRWTKPFGLDQSLYPEPYTYRVIRSLISDDEWLPVSDFLSDTVYTDNAINTDELQYVYKVVLFVPSISGTAVDTSSAASTVRLAATPDVNGVTLTWQAMTPWYNFSDTHRYHLIYRSDTGPEGTFVLIDSVNVNESGFTYTDNGEFQNRPLQEDVVYHYKVLTRGTYGNPKILNPLENQSQISGSMIRDVRPPCSPTVKIELTDCNAFNCTIDDYYNRISWTFEDPGCEENDISYRIYAAPAGSEEFAEISNTSETSFQHENLATLAYCYRVATVDAAGNLSEFSPPVCNDNCPWFELPNIITPDDMNGLNDQLISFGSESGTNRCTRFVKEVRLKIFNRWGLEVYSAHIEDPQPEQIYWDGSSNAGKKLDGGLYFYSASVTFDAFTPASRHKTFKGWIELVRDH